MLENSHCPPRPGINMDGVFEAANPTKCLIFMHATRGIQHTLLVGSPLRNITSAGRHGVLPTAAGILSCWEKPSLLEAPGYTRNWWHQGNCFIKPCVMTATRPVWVSLVQRPRVGCLCFTESRQGLPHLRRVTRTVWASNSLCWWPLRAGLPALGRCYLSPSAESSRDHRIMKWIEDHPAPDLLQGTTTSCSYFLWISTVQGCLLKTYYLKWQWGWDKPPFIVDTSGEETTGESDGF